MWCVLQTSSRHHQHFKIWLWKLWNCPMVKLTQEKSSMTVCESPQRQGATILTQLHRRCAGDCVELRKTNCQSAGGGWACCETLHGNGHPKLEHTQEKSSSHEHSKIDGQCFDCQDEKNQKDADEKATERQEHLGTSIVLDRLCFFWD